MTFLVQVGWAVTRPPADHVFSAVSVLADGPVDAQLVAAQMVASRPECVMPTSTRVLASAP